MHVDTRPRTYRAVDGSVREYQQALLRRSYRNAQGKPAKETLANLSMLPAEVVEVLRKSLAGKTLVDVDGHSISNTLWRTDMSPQYTRWPSNTSAGSIDRFANV